MTNALITGIKGFAGSYLAEFLLAKGYHVAGFDYSFDDIRNIQHIRERLELHTCDLRDPASLSEVISVTKPNEIYHLAGIAHVPTSYRDVRLTFDVNLQGTLNLFEAVKAASRDIKILYVGSASEYGAVREEDIPISENVLLRPVDPYSVSKISGDMLGFQYFKSFKMQVVRVRPFNHIGPRQSPDYVLSSFAKQVAEIEKGYKEPILRVGNLETKRDFTDVRDVVRAYYLALTQGKPGEVYNICSEKASSISGSLEQLLDLSIIAKQKFTLEPMPEKMRPSDVPLLLGDCSKFKHRTDWNSTITFKQTLKDLLDYWRESVAS